MNHELHKAILAILEDHEALTPSSADQQRIATADPREVLADFADLLWRSDNKTGWHSASSAFLQLAERLPVSAWPAMDQSIRNWVRCPGARILPTDTFSLRQIFRRLTGTTEPTFPSPAHVLIALCHHSGPLREQALSSVDQLPPLLATCLLMVRANDWVQPIRAAATKAIPASIGRLEVNERLRLLPLAVHFRDCGRLDRKDLPETWEHLLSSDVDDDTWLEVWRKAPARQQRIYLSLLEPERNMPGRQLRMALLHSGNRLAMIFHLTRIFPHLSGQEREEAERIASTSRVPSIARGWMEHFLRNSPEEAVPRLVELLSSRSRSLRDFARFHLTLLSPMDFEKHYLCLLAEGADVPAALAGLAETAPETAHAVALEWLSSTIPTIRKAAILALSQEWIEANLSWALSTQAWDSPPTSKATRARLSEIPRSVGRHVLQNQQTLAESPEIRRFIIRQIPRFSKWDGLELMLLLPAYQLDDGRYGSEFSEWSMSEQRTYCHLPSDRRARLLALIENYSFSAKMTAERWSAKTLKLLVERAE